MMLPIVTWLIILSLVAVNWSLEVRRFVIDIERGSSVNVRLLTNCTRASLVSIDPQVEIRFEGDCSSDLVRIIHLGFHQPTEHVHEFALETHSRVSLVSLKVLVKESPKLAKLLRNSRKGIPVLRVNQSLAELFNFSGGCRARVRSVPKQAVLTGLCDDPRLWSECTQIGDLQTRSTVDDSLVLTLIADGDELNVGILINPNEQAPAVSFDANLRVEIVPRLLIAIRRNVLSSTEDDSTIFQVDQQVSSCSFVRVFSKTLVSQFTQRSLHRLEVGLYCRKEFDEATISLIALNALGLSSEPFFVTLSKSISIDLSIKPLLVHRGTRSAAMVVKSSRDAELRIVEGLARGILSTDGLPVVSFGTNVPLEYKANLGLGFPDELISDSLVVNYCNVEFIIPVLLLITPARIVDVVTSLIVVEEHQTVLSPKFLKTRVSNFGNIHFELLKNVSSSAKLFVHGNRSRTFSMYDIADLSVSLRNSDASRRRAKLEFRARVNGGNATSLVCELRVLKPREDSKPPVQADCSLQLTVHPRSLRVPLDRSTLDFRDDHERDENNEYESCASSVYFVFDSQNIRENGYFGYANGEQTNRFSQSDVNRGKVFYYTPTVFSRMNARKILFDFRAVDMHGNFGPTLKLQVYLKALKISKTIHSEVVFDGDGSPIGADILTPAFNSSGTLFGIISLPSLGKISKRKSETLENELRLWDNFSYSELASRSVWYETDRRDVESDTFELLAVNPKDHIVQKRKAHERAKLKRRKFTRNAMQYIRIVVKITSADQMTGTEGGKERLKFHITVAEGRKDSVSIKGVNFTLIEPPKDGHVYIAQEADSDSQMITYVHAGREIGVDTAVDSFVLQNSSDEAEVNVLVLPVDNTAPVIKAEEATVVLEGESAAVNWDVTDVDSKVFWCHIPEQPVFGQLVIRAQKFTEFNNSDSRSIVYEQLKHAHVEPSEDYFKVRCSDGVNLSPLKQIQIVIKDQNDEAPHLAVDEVTVLEGREATLKIHASDQDSPRSDLRFTVNKSPQHGLIATISADGHNEAVLDFSEKSLSRVVYVHDNSENHNDSFELTVSDGRHSAKQVVTVRVLAVDDEPPELVVNRGIRVEVGTSVVIDARHLQVDDIDSTPDTIYFKIVEGPQNGILLHTADKNQPIASFRLEDVKLQNVVYVHRSKICCRNDSFTFRITDGFNETPLHEFNITVHLAESFVPQVTRTHETRLRHRHRTEQLFNISGVQWLAVTKWPSNGNLSFGNDTVDFTIDEALASGATEDTVAIVFQNGTSSEAATFNLEWCVVSLTEHPSDPVSGTAFPVELRRSGCDSPVEGLVRSSLGDFPFLIPSSMRRKSVPLSIPENYSGEFHFELTSVHGCLIDASRKRFRTVVLPPVHYLQFDHEEYSVGDPGADKLRETLFVRVVRGNTATKRSNIGFRAVTVPGTAREFGDFEPLDKEFILRSEDDGLTVPVEILGGSRPENSRFFTILLEPSENSTRFSPSKTVVRIIDARALPSFTEFPVIFALDPETGNPLTHSRLLPRGASFYCASECDPLHPRHKESYSGFNASEHIRYQWKTSDVTGLRSIKSRSFCLRTNLKILQSFVYLLPGSTVVCSAKIATADGESAEISSEPYLISSDFSSFSCPGPVGSTPFSSKLRVGSTSNPSTELSFDLSLILPHHDGSLPFWSTRPILVGDTEKQFYASKHVCSNMLQDCSETKFAPNVTSCTWNYDHTYSMSELLNCGARLDEAEVDDFSTVSLLLPIHVMYLVHQSPKKWHHVSMSSELRVSFVYRNRVACGSRLEQLGTTHPSAILELRSTSLDTNGSLLVVFETFSNFDGLLAADAANFDESVIGIRDSNTSESLFRLTKSEILSKRKLRWIFSSLVSHAFYASNVSLSFLPCVGEAADCKLVRDKPITLILPVHIQPGQTSTQNYSLESQLLLTRKQFWMKDLPDMDNVIHEGEAVYGAARVFNQDFPDQVLITRIQKCFICHDVFGMAQNESSRCPYKVIDSDSAASVHKEFRGLLASKHSRAFSDAELSTLREKNADGFIFDSTPLFEYGNESRQWRVHCVFAVSFGTSRGRRHSEQRLERGVKILEKSALLRLQRAPAEPMSLTVAHTSPVGVAFLFIPLTAIMLMACLRRKTRTYTSVPPAEPVRPTDPNAESLL